MTNFFLAISAWLLSWWCPRQEEIVHPTTCDCCDTQEDALRLLFKEEEECKEYECACGHIWSDDDGQPCRCGVVDTTQEEE